MATSRQSATIRVMIEAAQKAGRGLVRDFGEIENLQISRKGPGDFASTADLKAEKSLKASLSRARPKFGFMMEESAEVKGEDPTCRWIADPLDGTTNFLHGLPHWSVSVALEKDTEIVAGVVYDPLRDETFWAEKGLGAYVDNRRLQVSGRKSLADALIATYLYEKDVALDLLALQSSGLAVRTLGSACLDLCYVAAGRLDGFFSKGPLKAWDAAAGSLIVREARGTVTDLSGGKDYIYGGNIFAGNAPVHGALIQRFGAAPGVKAAKAAT